MNFPLPARRSLVATVTALVLVALGLSAAGASALSLQKPKSEGNSTFALTGKAGKVLKRSGVKVKRIAPAKLKRNRGNAVAKLPVGRISFGDRNVARLDGGVVFRKGKRSVRLDRVKVTVRANGGVIHARTVLTNGKKRSVRKQPKVFKFNGKAVFGATGETRTVRVRNGKLKFTNGLVKTVRRQLRLKKAPRGAIGRFSHFAKYTEFPPVDPFEAQCGVKATSMIMGTATPAAPLPELTGEVVGISEPVTWGIRQSLRGYLGSGAPFGVIEGLDGATVNRVPGPPLPLGFTWPAAAGEYASNSADTFTDDQAVINGTGSILLCHKEQFRILISNPTIVLDGENSRLIADVDTNNKGVWTESQRVDLVDLDVSGVTPDVNEDATELTWEDVPTALTAAGSQALTLCDAAAGAPGDCLYGPGAAMDALTFSVSTENPVALCSITNPAGFGTEPVYVPATPTPAVTDGEVSGGSLDWGFRRSLRTSVNSGGAFGLANGALRSDPLNMGEDTPTPPATTQKFFTWPAVGGNFDGGGDESRLVLEGRGNVSFCNVNFGGYGIVISNPTVVVDGADSFISADVAVRQGPEWAKGRVDLVHFDVSDITPTSDVGETETDVTWEVPAAEVFSSGAVPGTPSASSSLLNAIAGAGRAPGFDRLRINATVVNPVVVP
jgi:hypothetical protein